MEEELWLPIVGYEEFYHISNFGRVKKLARIFPPDKAGRKRISKEKVTLGTLSCSGGERFGYMEIGLTKMRYSTKNYRVHRLVASHFINKDLIRNEVNHIDGDTINNHVDNLEWCTPKENTIHAINANLRKSSPISASYNGKHFGNYTSIKLCSLRVGISMPSIYKYKNSGESFRGWKFSALKQDISIPDITTTIIEDHFIDTFLSKCKIVAKDKFWTKELSSDQIYKAISFYLMGFSIKESADISGVNKYYIRDLLHGRNLTLLTGITSSIVRPFVKKLKIPKAIDALVGYHYRPIIMEKEGEPTGYYFSCRAASDLTGFKTGHIRDTAAPNFGGSTIFGWSVRYPLG